MAELAPALRSGKWMARALRRELPAVQWIEQLLDCRDAALLLIERGEASLQVRRAVGDARRALLEPARLTAALHELRAALAAALPEQATR